MQVPGDVNACTSGLFVSPIMAEVLTFVSTDKMQSSSKAAPPAQQGTLLQHKFCCTRCSASWRVVKARDRAEWPTHTHTPEACQLEPAP